MIKNNCYKQKILILKKHVILDFGGKVIEKRNIDHCFMPNFNYICINKNTNNKKKFYLLVHEIGHMINSLKQKEYETEHPNNVYTKIISSNVLTNEIMAWEAGKNFLENLSIDYDKLYFDKIKADCINTYVLSSVENIYGFSLKRLNKLRRI